MMEMSGQEYYLDVCLCPCNSKAASLQVGSEGSLECQLMSRQQTPILLENMEALVGGVCGYLHEVPILLKLHPQIWNFPAWIWQPLSPHSSPVIGGLSNPM